MMIHRNLGNYTFYLDAKADTLFCDNETNFKKLCDVENRSAYTKDGINDYLVHGHHDAVSINATGTKATANYDILRKLASIQQEVRILLLILFYTCSKNIMAVKPHCIVQRFCT